jgi:hypothetical protein
VAEGERRGFGRVLGRGDLVQVRSESFSEHRLDVRKVLVPNVDAAPVSPVPVRLRVGRMSSPSPFRSMSFITHHFLHAPTAWTVPGHEGWRHGQPVWQALAEDTTSYLALRRSRMMCSGSGSTDYRLKVPIQSRHGPIAAPDAGTSIVDTRNRSGDVGSPLRSLDQYQYGRHVLYSTTSSAERGRAFQSPSSFRQYHIGDPCRRLGKQGKEFDRVGTS